MAGQQLETGVRGDLEWASIPALARSAAERFGDDAAVIDGDAQLSFVELAKAEAHLAVDQRVGIAEALGRRAHQRGCGPPHQVPADPRLHLGHVDQIPMSSSVVVTVASSARVLSMTASA